MPNIQPLTTLEQFRAVERLEAAIWGAVDLVPVPILAVSVRRGAVLLGAYEEERLVGFVFSFPAMRSAAADSWRLSHWSHMLGVHPDARGSGLGATLKLAQRDAVLRMGLDLIEWTYDPLQSLNAHLNFVKLGVIVEDYEENIYGESTSILHGGLPTDRLVCQWWIRRPHVERRIAPSAVRVVAREVTEAPVVNRTVISGEWLMPRGFDADHDSPRVKVDIPLEFGAMLSADPGLARAWRFETRAIFQHYLARQYRVVDFGFDPAQRRGQYLLTTIRPTEGDGPEQRPLPKP
jgi:predicted GNAT superfamily acetyltransferase